MQCRDGGTCHHYCSESYGCFREQSCVPLSGYSGPWGCSHDLRERQIVAISEEIEAMLKAAQTRKPDDVSRLVWATRIWRIFNVEK